MSTIDKIDAKGGGSRPGAADEGSIVEFDTEGIIDVVEALNEVTQDNLVKWEHTDYSGMHSKSSDQYSLSILEAYKTVHDDSVSEAKFLLLALALDYIGEPGKDHIKKKYLGDKFISLYHDPGDGSYRLVVPIEVSRLVQPSLVDLYDSIRIKTGKGSLDVHELLNSIDRLAGRVP